MQFRSSSVRFPQKTPILMDRPSQIKRGGGRGRVDMHGLTFKKSPVTILSKQRTMKTSRLRLLQEQNHKKRREPELKHNCPDGAAKKNRHGPLLPALHPVKKLRNQTISKNCFIAVPRLSFTPITPSIIFKNPQKKNTGKHVMREQILQTPWLSTLHLLSQYPTSVRQFSPTATSSTQPNCKVCKNLKNC